MSDLLREFVALYRGGTASHRDALLAAGRVGQRLIVERTGDGQDRVEVVDEMAEAIDRTPNDVTRIVRVAAAVDLLRGKDGLGDASWSVLREFHCAAVRDRDTEEWELCPDNGEQYRKLFVEAIRKKWTRDEVKRRVTALRGLRGGQGQRAPSVTVSASRVAPDDDDEWEDAEPEQATGRSRKFTAGSTASTLPPLKVMAEAGTPRDVADMCVELVRASKRPADVAARVVRELERLGLLAGAMV